MTSAIPEPSAMSRRGFLRAVSTLWPLPFVAGPLAACGSLAGGGLVATSRFRGAEAPLLLPLTGAAAEIGHSMARAASLVTQGADPASVSPVIDTGDTAAGAVAAARDALQKGAKILMGPLKADQARAVLAVAGNVPVVTFSNDDSLAQAGAFVMGITPAQSVATMFSYARAQNLTRIAVLARQSPLGAATATAAQTLAAAGGLTLTAVLVRDPSQQGHVAALKAASGGVMPQAVFLPDGGAALKGFAAGLRDAGTQVLGSVQWGADDAQTNSALSGAWFAAPAPDLFLPFADRYQVAFDQSPGVIGALGHDAALIASGLGSAGLLNRKGLTRKAGFTGALGPFRFLEDGRCQRDLTVLTFRDGSISVLAEVSGS